MGDNNTAKDTPAAVGKSEEPSRDGSASSIATTPEPEAESYSAQEQPQQQQKRKGGRKPIYATSEERKQRNRQAQAAFRERRTEYIKQLESTIKHHEETLQTLQQNHRSAADECLMLRYKNSLLERILLEKGIDVQAELRAKTGSPHLGPTRVPPPGSAVQPPMQRAIMNRHQQARRSFAGFPQKFSVGSGLPSASSVNSAAGNGISGNGNGPSAFYPSPFQSHMDQLGKLLTSVHIEQEYDAQADMIDDRDASEHSASTAPYPPQFPPNMQPQGTPQLQGQGAGQMAPQQFQGQDQYTSPQALQPTDGQHSGYAVSGNINHGFDPYDPILDADPFGLSASMHFPTQFSYQTG
ncbi:hypothetical protein SLS58_006145 [Diplodia intermedia]|uniref:BZIP domain-containing protein n=1 Tax=Diplodia intermedia TaxID=856260 RepID=A0ABR3TP47_9PEZI